VVNSLKEDHDIVLVGLRRGDITCDYTDPASVMEMFKAVENFDALISVVGNDSVFKPYQSLEDSDYLYGFQRKFLGQIRLVTMGRSQISNNGVFILTSGFLSHYPNEYSIATGPLNAAVDTFVVNTAPLLNRGIRLNVVSPAPVVEMSQKGTGLVTAQDIAPFCQPFQISSSVRCIWYPIPATKHFA